MCDPLSSRGFRPKSLPAETGVRVDKGRVIGVVTGAALVAAGGTLAVVVWPGGSRVDVRARFQEPASAVVEVAAAEPSQPAKAYAGPAIKVKSRNLDIAPTDRNVRSVAVPERVTERFSMVSLTWTDPKDAPAGAVQVRTRSVGDREWSGWRSLETEESHGPDRAVESKGVRGGTGAIWVGESDGVQARLADGGAPLPTGLRLHLIDPGTAKAGAGKTSGGQGGMAVAFPPYTSRAGWGADETLTSGTPAYADSVNVQFVHHTAGSNTYSCADSPAILRGILYDHTQNRGWADIGYNFLVDKCGTLFEGRRGGVDQPVIGAHTYGFNTLSSGIAVLGDYRTSAVPDAVVTMLARVAAAKLGQYGLDPAGKSELREGVSDGKFPLGTVVTFDRVSGHRDGVNTECPGDVLYGKLPAIRTAASAGILGLSALPLTGGVAGGGYYYVKSQATVNWSTVVPSEELTGFELLVDGVVVGSVPATARSAPVVIGAGVHRVQVRGTHVIGATATTPAQTVVGDGSAPTFPTPATLTFRTGAQVSATSAPVKLTWQAADNNKLSSVALTSPSARTFAPTTTTYATTAPVGSATTWSLTARDLVGNTATSAVARTPALLSEQSATRSGSWTTKIGSTSAYLSGKALYTGSRGSKLSWTFTGRGMALIVARTPTSGRADVYVNGTRVTTVDLWSSTSSYRQVIYARNISRSPATATVQIVNQATSGRPGITIDGLAYFK